MKTNTAGIVFFAGMIITLGAVGGMDHQPGYLLEQTLAAFAGLALMYAGSQALKDSY